MMFQSFSLKQIAQSRSRVCPPKSVRGVCRRRCLSSCHLSADELLLCSILISSTGAFNSSLIQTAIVIPSLEVTAAGASLAAI